MADYADQSLYPQPTNPLTNLENAVNVGGGVARNKLMQQELGANQGLQDLYANAPKDANGNIDQNYLQQNAGQAGIRAPEVIQAAQGAQVTAQQIQQQQLATQRSKMSMMAAAILPVVKPGATPSDVVSAINDLKQNSGGSFKDADFAPIFSGMAAHLANGGNISDYAQRLSGQLLAGGGDPAMGMKLLYGEPTAIHTGGGTTTGSQSPVTGAVSSSTYLPDTLPPTTPTKDSDPNSPTFGQTNYLGSAGPSVPTLTGAGAPASSPLAGAFKATGSSGAAPAAQPVAELAPGQQAMLGDAGKAAQTRVDNTIQTAAQSRVSQDVNQQVINLASNLKDNVGPAKTGWTSLVSKIADVPGLGDGMKAVLDKDPTDTGGQLQELQKYLLRSAQLRGQQLGLSGTDYQTSLMQHANPNDQQFPSTIKKLAQYNLALDAMEQGKANAMDTYPGAKTDPNANQKFENEFRNAINPNVYRAMISSPQERQELYSTMTPAQRQQMVLDRRKLATLGAIPSQLSNAYQPAAGTQ